jgi:hypothetical protein
VHQRPERVALQLMAALCDILGCGVEDLVTVTATDVRKKKAASGNNRTVLPPQPVEQPVHRATCGVATIVGRVTADEHGLIRREVELCEWGRVRESVLLADGND